ncbi:MAG: diguanylate cyclase domain-containing protein [Deltaproteobacteria bacterium]
MHRLSSLLSSNEDFLIKRVLQYAKLHNYVKYTSTLEEAWKVSIDGLSRALQEAALQSSEVPELDIDKKYDNDRLVAFGVLEAQRHRDRGITLGMFLGLMKYYRQAFLDLVEERGGDILPEQAPLFVNRVFDQIEIAFCTEWANAQGNDLMSQLQTTNRGMTNEKNKYLTIFESIPTPVIILDENHRINNMNLAAVGFLTGMDLNPGSAYYSEAYQTANMIKVLPWLVQEFKLFVESDEVEITLEKDVDLPKRGLHNLVIKFHRMLDVSDKFRGTVIIFTDLTERKLAEDQLRYLSFHDNMTGLYNRAYFEQELLRMESDRFNPVGIIVCDVDGLKKVNDQLGHQAGDLLLETVGAILRKSFRDSDVVARIGGDEFAAILPGSDESVVEMVCGRIKQELASHNSEKPHIPISISIGYAVGGARETGINQLFKKADDDMYINKPHNRNAYGLLYKAARNTYGERFFKE